MARQLGDAFLFDAGRQITFYGTLSVRMITYKVFLKITAVDIPKAMNGP